MEVYFECNESLQCYELTRRCRSSPFVCWLHHWLVLCYLGLCIVNTHFCRNTDGLLTVFTFEIRSKWDLMGSHQEAIGSVFALAQCNRAFSAWTSSLFGLDFALLFYSRVRKWETFDKETLIIRDTSSYFRFHSRGEFWKPDKAIIWHLYGIWWHRFPFLRNSNINPFFQIRFFLKLKLGLIFHNQCGFCICHIDNDIIRHQKLTHAKTNEHSCNSTVAIQGTEPKNIKFNSRKVLVGDSCKTIKFLALLIWNKNEWKNVTENNTLEEDHSLLIGMQIFF